MNRHLVVVELDARLFDDAAHAGGYIERTLTEALDRDGLRALEHDQLIDLRPAITCMGERAPIRSVGNHIVESADDEWDGAHLGVQSNGTLIEELSHRAELGDTDRGLDYRPRVTI